MGQVNDFSKASDKSLYGQIWLIKDRIGERVGEMLMDQSVGYKVV